MSGVEAVLSSGLTAQIWSMVYRIPNRKADLRRPLDAPKP